MVSPLWDVALTNLFRVNYIHAADKADKGIALTKPLKTSIFKRDDPRSNMRVSGFKMNNNNETGY